MTSKYIQKTKLLWIWLKKYIPFFLSSAISTYATTTGDQAVDHSPGAILEMNVETRFLAITDGYQYNFIGRVLAPIHGISSTMPYYRKSLLLSQSKTADLEVQPEQLYHYWLLVCLIRTTNVSLYVYTVLSDFLSLFYRYLGSPEGSHPEF